MAEQPTITPDELKAGIQTGQYHGIFMTRLDDEGIDRISQGMVRPYTRQTDGDWLIVRQAGEGDLFTQAAELRGMFSRSSGATLHDGVYTAIIEYDDDKLDEALRMHQMGAKFFGITIAWAPLDDDSERRLREADRVDVKLRIEATA